MPKADGCFASDPNRSQNTCPDPVVYVNRIDSDRDPATIFEPRTLKYLETTIWKDAAPIPLAGQSSCKTSMQARVSYGKKDGRYQSSWRGNTPPGRGSFLQNIRWDVIPSVWEERRRSMAGRKEAAETRRRRSKMVPRWSWQVARSGWAFSHLSSRHDGWCEKPKEQDNELRIKKK